MLPLLNAKKKKFFTNIVVDEREVDDNATQLAALDMALKLKGSYPRKEDEPAASDNEFKLTIEYIGNGPGTGPGGRPRMPGQPLPGEPRTIENPAPPQNHPSRDEPVAPTEPNPVDQVVPPTVPISPKTQVAGFVRFGRPRRFWNPGRT